MSFTLILSLLLQGNSTFDYNGLCSFFLSPNDNYHIHTANCYYNYYQKYVDIFFRPRPGEELLKLMPHKRSWILQSVKRFGDYYLNRYGTIDIKQLISRIIERHQLNKNLDMKDKIYLVSPQFVAEKIDKIITIPGEIGYTCRLGLLCGLREQEIFYIKEKPICYQAYGCDCDKLDVVNCKNNSMTVIAIGWSKGNKTWLLNRISVTYIIARTRLVSDLLKTLQLNPKYTKLVFI